MSKEELVLDNDSNEVKLEDEGRRKFLRTP